MTKTGSAQSSVNPSPKATGPGSGPARFDLRRVYTASILIPVVYGIIRYLPPWTFTLLVIMGGCMALFELYRISFGEHMNRLLVWMGLITAAVIMGRAHLAVPLADLLLLATMTIVVVGLLFSSAAMDHRLRITCTALFGVLYIGLTLSSLVLTRTFPGGEFFILFLALVTWAGDTGAYYSGRLWGRHLLAPRVSPKKTMEGLLGGMALALVTALLAQIWFLQQLRLVDALILGMLLTGAGLLGDLCESAMKRSAGVKDSGGILPGHGGMLDRLDSLLFTAPTFYYYVIHVRGLSPV